MSDELVDVRRHTKKKGLQPYLKENNISFSATDTVASLVTKAQRLAQRLGEGKIGVEPTPKLCSVLSLDPSRGGVGDHAGPKYVPKRASTSIH